MLEPGLAAAFLVGLAGGVHCLGMCGGIVTALSLGLPETQGGRLWAFQLAYNAGRLVSYTVAGALAGLLGALAMDLSGLAVARQLLQLAAGLMMLALGLYLGGWWRGLLRLEALGGHLWRHIEPLGRRFLPVRDPPSALWLGMVWGWLPCGLIYSVLVWALAAGGAGQGALLMLSFGLGTLPNLLLMGVFAARLGRWLRRPGLRHLAGALVIALAGLQLAWAVRGLSG